MKKINLKVGDKVIVKNLEGTGVENERRLIGMSGIIGRIDFDLPMPYFVVFKKERMMALSFFASNISLTC